VVLPTLNEVHGLQVTLPGLPSYASEVIVVDGGSTDGSPEVVGQLRPDALLLSQDGRGKGNALKTGIRAATGDIIVTMDADGSMDPGDIHAAVGRLLQGHHFVKGSRCLPGGGSDDFTPVRKAGNSFLTGVANAAVGGRFTDITYGFNAYWREVQGLVGDLAEGFEFEIQLAIRAARSGLRTSEVACHEATRVGGASKLHAVKDGWQILRAILSEARAGEPHRWHLPEPRAAVAEVDFALMANRDAVG
jgi:glycosyltransferase involved in cell wall biosynthesis